MPNSIGGTVKYGQYLNTVEKLVRESVSRAHPRSWNENYVTYSIAEAFQRQLRMCSIEGLSKPMQVHWDAFKLNGNLENDHGDLAVLVRYHSGDSAVMEGVGFLEAKRVYPNSGAYDAIKWPQLEHQARKTRYASLLLYETSQVSDFSDNIVFQPFTPRRASTNLEAPFSYAVVVQTSIALQLRSKDRSLHKYSIPLSHQICARYLRCLDLDFDADTVRSIKGYANSDFSGPHYLLVATVSVADTDSEGIDVEVINGDTYTPLDIQLRF